MLETSNIIWLGEWDLDPLTSGDASRQLPFFLFWRWKGRGGYAKREMCVDCAFLVDQQQRWVGVYYYPKTNIS